MSVDPRKRFRAAFFEMFDHHDRSEALYEAMLGIIDDMVTQQELERQQSMMKWAMGIVGVMLAANTGLMATCIYLLVTQATKSM